MRHQHAVILAASATPGLGLLTADQPLAMIEIAGRALIDRQLDALASRGVRSVCVVAGHQQRRLRDYLGPRAAFVLNLDYRSTGSLYSLWLACDALQAGAVVVPGHLLVTPQLLERLMEADGPDAVVYDPSQPLAPGATGVTLAGSFVTDIGAHLAQHESAGLDVGLLKFGPEGARRLTDVLSRMVLGGALESPAHEAVAALARDWPILGVDTDRLPWTAIARPEDVERAALVVAPAIDGLAPGFGTGVRR